MTKYPLPVSCVNTSTGKHIDKAYALLKENDIKVISEPVLSSEKIDIVFFCLDPKVQCYELNNLYNYYTLLSYS